MFYHGDRVIFTGLVCEFVYEYDFYDARLAVFPKTLHARRRGRFTPPMLPRALIKYIAGTLILVFTRPNNSKDRSENQVFKNQRILTSYC